MPQQMNPQNNTLNGNPITISKNGYQSQITEELKYRKAAEKKLKKEIADYEDTIRKTSDQKIKAQAQQRIKDLQKQQDDLEQSSAKKLGDLKKKQQQELDDLASQNAETIANNISTKLSGAVSKAVNSISGLDLNFSDLSSFTTSLTSTIDKISDDFLKQQSAIAYNINGNGSLSSAINTLNSALAGTGIVKQSEVYSKLASLVESGITFDAEQRAYLSALSDEVKMDFNMESKSLNRLINLQRDDLSDNRMAIQASLQTFLNQNYQTSQYIKDGFEGVSDALIEAQSLMSSNDASAFETVVQKWMGSLSSVGMDSSTVSSIATALNQISVGDLDIVNTDMMKLMTLGANQAGLSMGTLLAGNLSDTQVDQLMTGVIDVITNMISTASNNVVESQLAKTFGLKVSDVKAVENLTTIATTGIITDNISTAFLDKMDGYIYSTTQISNAIQNLVYNMATNIASDETQYTIYKGLEIASGLAASILDGTTVETAPLGVGVSIDLGEVTRLAPLLSIVPALLQTGIASVGNLYNGATGASSIYENLGGSQGMSISSAGSFTASTSSGSTSSGSMIIQNENSTDITKSAYQSAQDQSSDIIEVDEEAKSFDDLYNLLANEGGVTWWLYTGVESIIASMASFNDSMLSVANSASNIDASTTSIATGISAIQQNVNASLSDINSNITAKLDSIITALDTIGNNTNSSNMAAALKGSVSVTVGGTSTAQQGTSFVNGSSTANADYISSALVVSALNLQNIYNLLENWYKANNTAGYTEYNTASYLTGSNGLTSTYSSSTYNYMMSNGWTSKTSANSLYNK